ncbi:DUF4184 family protein [Actinoalloteichus hymeniacidonis]|uniref:DUF4184 family protein n=1 Tax=Actinoalloteichus hymeniacidonis TaxID=340345 RepID=UPI000853C687|nr:DUF4184 family protein [Actinoalloteichus hymeniacidonis]MBB5908191.1 membrane protein implicated in regulation of membrane protease activity [Actinoalloteichus hymeniacidonis]
MPFTLTHPAAVLPLLRPPFVAAALVAGALAPDLPYYLSNLGLTSTSAQDWYGVLLPNATQTHSLWGLVLNLPLAVALVVVYWLLRAPINGILPAAIRLPPREPLPGWRDRVRFAMWLLLSAGIGIATHLLWDLLTVSLLLQAASTIVGAVATGWYLWRRRDRVRDPVRREERLRPAVRWGVVALLVAVPLAAAAVGLQGDYQGFRQVEVVDLDNPITIDFDDGTSETTYPTTTAEASFGTLAEGMVTGAAKRAGAAFVAAVLVYAVVWHVVARTRRSTMRPEDADAPLTQ